MSNAKPVVLIFDDDPICGRSLRTYVRGYLNDAVNIVQAETVEEGLLFFNTMTEMPLAIVIDGSMPVCVGIAKRLVAPETEDLVRLLKLKGFAGPLIACSNFFNDVLIKAGCTESCKKSDLHIYVADVIKRQLRTV